MEPYKPWYLKLSLLQCLAGGALVVMLVNLFTPPSSALLKLDIIFDPQTWGSLRSYAVVGEFSAAAVIGALGGWAGYLRLQRKQRDM